MSLQVIHPCYLVNRNYRKISLQLNTQTFELCSNHLANEGCALSVHFGNCVSSAGPYQGGLRSQDPATVCCVPNVDFGNCVSSAGPCQ